MERATYAEAVLAQVRNATVRCSCLAFEALHCSTILTVNTSSPVNSIDPIGMYALTQQVQIIE